VVVEEKMALARFKTKTELKEYFRVLLGEVYEEGKRGVETSGEKRAFIEELLGHHPASERKLEGLKRYDVVCTGVGGKGGPIYAIMLRYEDGREDDISWLKCIANMNMKGKAKAYKKRGGLRHELTAALRNAVAPQITAYRRGNVKMVCSNCGMRVPDGPLHVDHEGTGFTEMAKAFLGGLSDADRARMDGGVVSDPEVQARHCFRPDVEDLETSWQTYHAERAVLQMACATCNLSVLRVAHFNENDEQV
jgi:hypothetical protein